MAELDEIIDKETKDEVVRLFREFPQLWKELIPIEGIYLAPITTDWFFDRVDEETMLKNILSCGRMGHSIFCLRVWNPGTNRLLPFLFCWKKKRSDFYLFIELSVPAWAPQWNDYLLKGKLNEFFVKATEELNRVLSSDK